MAVLMDTHALLWWATDDTRLTLTAHHAIRSADKVFVSAVSAIEIAIKIRIGKLPEAVPLFSDFEIELSHRGFHGLPVTLAHARIGGSLNGNHRDPFDRILAAQSLIEGMPLISADAVLDGFGIHRIW